MVPPPLCSPYHLQNQTNSLRAWLQTKRATLFLNLSNFGTAIQHLWGHWSLYIGMHEYVQRRLDNSEVDAHRNTSTKYRWTDMNWTAFSIPGTVLPRFCQSSQSSDSLWYAETLETLKRQYSLIHKIFLKSNWMYRCLKYFSVLRYCR